jgi:hypothetical protein
MWSPKHRFQNEICQNLCFNFTHRTVRLWLPHKSCRT